MCIWYYRPKVSRGELHSYYEDIKMKCRPYNFVLWNSSHCFCFWFCWKQLKWDVNDRWRAVSNALPIIIIKEWNVDESGKTGVFQSGRCACCDESERFQPHEKQWTWRQEIKIINPADVQDVRAAGVTRVAYGCFKELIAMKCRWRYSYPATFLWMGTARRASIYIHLKRAFSV